MIKIKQEEDALGIFKKYIEEKVNKEEVEQVFNSFKSATEIDITSIISKYGTILDLFTFEADIIEKIAKEFKEEFDKKYNEKDKTHKAAIGGLSKFFNKLYSDFTKKRKKKTDAYDVIEQMKISACPYCNLNYINAIIFKKNSKKEHVLRHHLDHFFPKSIYPFLSLSFYNLIVSCYECNSALKGDKIALVNPYQTDFDDLSKFIIKLNSNSKNFLNYSKTDSFSIDLTNKNNKMVENHIEIFKILERYNCKKSLVSELLQKKIIYTQELIEEIKNNLSLNGFNETSIETIIWGNSIKKEDINSRPLTKLTKDIIES